MRFPPCRGARSRPRATRSRSRTSPAACSRSRAPTGGGRCGRPRTGTKDQTQSDFMPACPAALLAAARRHHLSVLPGRTVQLPGALDMRELVRIGEPDGYRLVALQGAASTDDVANDPFGVVACSDAAQREQELHQYLGRQPSAMASCPITSYDVTARSASALERDGRRAGGAGRTRSGRELWPARPSRCSADPATYFRTRRRARLRGRTATTCWWSSTPRAAGRRGARADGLRGRRVDASLPQCRSH